MYNSREADDTHDEQINDLRNSLFSGIHRAHSRVIETTSDGIFEVVKDNWRDDVFDANFVNLRMNAFEKTIELDI